jgi:hypothetical protein
LLFFLLLDSSSPSSSSSRGDELNERIHTQVGQIIQAMLLFLQSHDLLFFSRSRR